MFFGDLERLLAQAYPFRVPIAIAAVVILVATLVIARRRGWIRVLRRHPRIAGAAVAALLVVGLPLTWVLASPLVIRTQLIEDLPGVTAVGANATDATGAASDPAGPAVVVGEGAFMGADEFHFGSGIARVVEIAPGRHVLRFEDFSVRNGPDLFVYLSPDPDGYAEGSLELGALKATDGSFHYEIPTGTDIGLFRSAVVWCRAFSVLFATAPLATA